MIVFILGYDDAQDICGPGAAGNTQAQYAEVVKARKNTLLASGKSQPIMWSVLSFILSFGSSPSVRIACSFIHLGQSKQRTATVTGSSTTHTRTCSIAIAITTIVMAMMRLMRPRMSSQSRNPFLGLENPPFS